MIFDRARADSKLTPRFLVGRAGGELLQHFALAPRQRFAPGKMQRCRFRGIALLPACIGPDRLIQRATISLPLNGFSMKSSAPFLIALTAIVMSPWPEIMKIGAG